MVYLEVQVLGFEYTRSRSRSHYTDIFVNHQDFFVEHRNAYPAHGGSHVQTGVVMALHTLVFLETVHDLVKFPHEYLDAYTASPHVQVQFVIHEESAVLKVDGVPVAVGEEAPVAASHEGGIDLFVSSHQLGLKMYNVAVVATTPPESISDRQLVKLVLLQSVGQVFVPSDFSAA